MATTRQLISDLRGGHKRFPDVISLCEYASRRMGVELTLERGRKVWEGIQPKPEPIRAIVGVCREDNPRDVDDCYGEGTYARLFPDTEAEGGEGDL